MNKSEVDVDLICNNCQYQISLHPLNCTTLLDGNDDDGCNCNKPEFYNVVILSLENILDVLKYIATIVEN